MWAMTLLMSRRLAGTDSRPSASVSSLARVPPRPAAVHDQRAQVLPGRVLQLEERRPPQVAIGRKHLDGHRPGTEGLSEFRPGRYLIVDQLVSSHMPASSHPHLAPQRVRHFDEPNACRDDL